jgi:hypothetical protein
MVKKESLVAAYAKGPCSNAAGKVYVINITLGVRGTGVVSRVIYKNSEVYSPITSGITTTQGIIIIYWKYDRSSSGD